MKKKRGGPKPPPADLETKLNALLDEGWAALEEFELEHAEEQAHKALDLAGSSAEATTLLGAIYASHGDHEAALEQYREAAELAPDLCAPKLLMAELLLSFEEDDEALAAIDEALAVASTPEEKLDARLLKAEALLMLGDRDAEVREVIAGLPPPPFPDPDFHLRAAEINAEVGELDEAERQFRAAIAVDESSADAWHGLGMIAEAREDHGAMVAAWKRARELDLAAPRPPWGLTKEEFEAIADRTLAELPKMIHERLENVPILASEYPDVAIIEEGWDPRILGFFSGVPYPERSHLDGASPHLDCVLLFQRNIERDARTKEEVEQEIRTTLIHETGHFFGLSDQDLEAMGLG